MLRGADHPRARLDDAGLFRGDFLDGMAEKIFVIEIDLRDDGDFRQQDVRGVETPAHADFAHRKFRRPRAAKYIEGHGGDALEKCRVRGQRPRGEQFLDDLVHARERGGEFGVGNFLAVQANALVDALQVRRSVEARAQARRAQNRSSIAEVEPLPLVPATCTD